MVDRGQVLEVVGRSCSSETIFVSLGDHCLPANLLRAAGLRHAAYPFDWIFASPEVVKHAIEDDFRTFLDRGYFRSTSPTEGVHRAEHEFYRTNFGQGSLFFHHDPDRNESHHAHYQRAVQRFRGLSGPVHFVLAVGANCEDHRLEALWSVVSSKHPQAKLTCVRQMGRSPGRPSIAIRRDTGGLTIAEINPSSESTGLHFEQLHDDVAILRLFLREPALG